MGAIEWWLTPQSTGAPNSGAVGFPSRFARRRPVIANVGPHARREDYGPNLHSLDLTGPSRVPGGGIAVRRLGHLSVAMEDWAASDSPPLEASLKAVKK